AARQASSAASSTPTGNRITGRVMRASCVEREMREWSRPALPLWLSGRTLAADSNWKHEANLVGVELVRQGRVPGKPGTYDNRCIVNAVAPDRWSRRRRAAPGCYRNRADSADQRSATTGFIAGRHPWEQPLAAMAFPAKPQSIANVARSHDTTPHPHHRRLTAPHPRVAEHAQPRRILTPALRRPAQVDAARSA